MAKTPILTKDGLIKYDNNIKDYINAAIDRVEISGAITLVGTLGTDGDITELPSTYKKGEMYQVATAGEYAGKKCEVGDFIVAVRDNRITLASLPVVPDYYNFNSYVIYQIYNPITNEYDNTIYYVATYESPYNIYKYKNEGDQYKILAFTACRKYETKNNGVTWDCTGHYESGLTEYESETINYKILYTAHPIYDGNIIAIPANPYTENSMDAFNADWAVIQGNIEDLIGEGVIYIDPDEETPDVGDIESITSASYVSYSNTDSGLEATNIQDAVDEINELKVNKSDIVDNLESTATNVPLSAKQGVVLNEKWIWKELTLNDNGKSYTDIPADANELDVIAMVRDGIGTTHYFHNVHIINFKSVYRNFALFDGNTKAYIRINNGTIILTNAYIGDTDVTNASALVVMYR